MLLWIIAAVESDLPSMAFHELFRNEQSDSRADRGACRKECIEDLRKNIRRNAHAIVCNRQNHTVCRQHGIADGYGKSATSWHSVDRICDQVGNDLHDLAATKHNFPGRFEGLLNGDSDGSAAVVIDRDGVFCDLAEGSAGCRRLFTIIAQCLFGDMRDSSEFAFGGVEGAYTVRGGDGWT